MYIPLARERERDRERDIAAFSVCDLMQMKRAAARGLGGYKAKSFTKFEPKTTRQTNLQLQRG